MSISHYDLVVYNGSPAGIACAVRAAREGLSVLLANHTPIFGGMISNGLCCWDTLYEGKRSPIYDELREALFAFYRDTYGEGSDQYRTCLPGPSVHSHNLFVKTHLVPSKGNNQQLTFESKVAQMLVEKMVDSEPNISCLMSSYPLEVVRIGPLIKSVTFGKMNADCLPDTDGARTEVSADSWADCSYEGDLMALCGAAYRFGREPRSEYQEPHAGKIFLKPSKEPPSDRLAFLGVEHAKLNLRKSLVLPDYQEVVEWEGAGNGDDRVQAFNFRTMLTNVAANRMPVERPKRYDPEYIKTLGNSWSDPPNVKHRVNLPQLVGPQNPYVDGSWEDRKKVKDDHWDAFLGLLYFARNDESEPEDRRKDASQWGLPNDEFVENGHRPYEMYTRETRRLEGRYVFTEHDATFIDDVKRARIHGDAIAVTDWFIDIHACTFEKLPGTLHEGKLALHQETFPGQIPYRAILPKGIDNLLVPVCVSSSHVGWSTIRLEPTWMNIAEAAAWAVIIAARNGVAPAEITHEALVRKLADSRVMISFFNDVDLGSDDTWIPAVTYFATKGFFPGYDAKADDTLDSATAEVWANAFMALKNGFTGEPMATARLAATAAQRATDPISSVVFHEMTGIPGHAGEDSPITRSDACALLYDALK